MMSGIDLDVLSENIDYLEYSGKVFCKSDFVGDDTEKPADKSYELMQVARAARAYLADRNKIKENKQAYDWLNEHIRIEDLKTHPEYKIICERLGVQND
ncbi:hypothetical protein [Dyadobacter bucti]|uniref:hypothetical protein n=1 Tax=Dyadobacter bucti TaxID=2572203 RepID=UPI0011096825|nr:hypothetical protein [Dyadobacter bucti]